MGKLRAAGRFRSRGRPMSRKESAMKPFDFRARFTGICATVPDKSKLSAATKAWVVMPGAELPNVPGKGALDGVGPPLCPHQAFVWFNLANTGEEDANVIVKLPLNQRRLTFAFEEAKPGLNDFKIVGRGTRSIKQLFQLQFHAPKQHLLHPDCARKTPHPTSRHPT